MGERERRSWGRRTSSFRGIAVSQSTKVVTENGNIRKIQEYKVPGVLAENEGYLGSRTGISAEEGRGGEQGGRLVARLQAKGILIVHDDSFSGVRGSGNQTTVGGGVSVAKAGRLQDISLFFFALEGTRTQA